MFLNYYFFFFFFFFRSKTLWWLQIMSPHPEGGAGCIIFAEAEPSSLPVAVS
jgi:hypothetical protein